MVTITTVLAISLGTAARYAASAAVPGEAAARLTPSEAEAPSCGR